MKVLSRLWLAAVIAGFFGLAVYEHGFSKAVTVFGSAALLTVVVMVTIAALAHASD